MGYNVGSNGADGDFGSNTQAAVIKFQQDKKLTKIDGEVGPETWEALCTAVSPTSPPSPATFPATQPAPTQCDPAKAEIIYPHKVYQNGIWGFAYGVYKGQGLTLKLIHANHNPLLDSLSVPHFKIEYGGKSKIIRFCNDLHSEPKIYHEVNPVGKKYDQLSWHFERIMTEPDLNGKLSIDYNIIIRTDSINTWESGENECYRFVPITTFTLTGTGTPATPIKFDKFTAFYKLDYGEDAGLVLFSDWNFFLANGLKIDYQKFVPSETKFQALAAGQQGAFDSIHNAHLDQSVYVPGCRVSAFDCLHMHWRWADMTPTIDPLVDTVTDKAVDSSQEGEPYLNPGQSVDVVVAKYSAGEAYVEDPTMLVNGETIGSTKTIKYNDEPGKPVSVTSRVYKLASASSYHPVIWVISSIPIQNQNEFFRNGLFVLDVHDLPRCFFPNPCK